MDDTFSACFPASPLQWLRIYRLYRHAFPRAERKPFSIILAMVRRGKTDVWYLTRGGRFAGLAATLNGGDVILLDYLAIAEPMRGQGVGTAALRTLLHTYAGKGFFVEIESTDEEGPDRRVRMRRRQFYLSNGLHPLGVTALVFGVKMELLGVGCEMDFAQYQTFYRTHYSPLAARNVVKA